MNNQLFLSHVNLISLLFLFKIANISLLISCIHYIIIIIIIIIIILLHWQG